MNIEILVMISLCLFSCGLCIVFMAIKNYVVGIRREISDIGCKIIFIEDQLDGVRNRLDETYQLYRTLDNHYNIILTRTDELSDKLSDKDDALSKQLTAITTKIDDINDCISAINEIFVPTIREEYKILEVIKQEILTETEKETDDDN